MLHLLQYTFFQNALLAGVLVAVLCAMIGTYVVTRRLVFVSGGIAHASLGGVGLGALLGFPPMLGAAGFALFSGWGIQWLGRRSNVREDSAIAMLWTLGMSIGVLCAYAAEGFMADLPSYLFGNILAVGRTDLLALGVLTVVVALLFSLRLQAIVTLAYDADFARTQGLHVERLETVLTALTVLTIVCCLHIAGIVMVISLLSVPQMTAALFARSFSQMIWGAMVFGLVSFLLGLALSCLFDVPSGASIILCAIVIYFVCKAIKSKIPVFHSK